MNISVYEVGPRDGLQYLENIVPTEEKKKLIGLLYDSGLAEIEEVSFAHPKRLPQMATLKRLSSSHIVCCAVLSGIICYAFCSFSFF